MQVDGDGTHVWVYEFDGGTFSQLTFEGQNIRPFWHPDGLEVGFVRLQVSEPGVYSRRADLRDAQSGKLTSWLDYEVDTRDPGRASLRLQYTFKSTGEAFDYRVPLQTTWPHFGGLRWWFTCPLVSNGRECRRRCEKLYLVPGGKYYGCRRCYDLAYQSQRENRSLRMLQKANKIRYDKLGGDRDGWTELPPPKPKGMHWKTYERLCREERTLRDRSLVVFAMEHGHGFI